MEASAPGKVLILGGYLIVQAPNVGISIGVNARFTTRVVTSAPSASGTSRLTVLSPQFGKTFVFECTVHEAEVRITQTEGPSSPFLYYAALYGIAAACSAGATVSHNVSLELLADNDFYSQRNYLESKGLPVNTANLRQLPRHLPLVGEVSKTGLGSSAAMTTSVVACIYSLFVHQDADKELIHRIAQVAHSVAQGKIGSGFDVFTAVYGTCAYRRFPAEKVEMMVKGAESPQSVSVAELATCVDMKESWVENVPFHLPQGIKLVLGDVHQGGSSTPGMVAKIMAWQKANAGNPDNLWSKLRENNEKYIKVLRALIQQSREHEEAHEAAVRRLSTVQHLPDAPAHSDAERLFVEAAQCASRSRMYLRELGVAAGVKVEPEELTGLLNDTAALPGVFAVGCPGAGGYDAVFALVLGDANCAAVEEFWENYKGMSVCPLTVREDPGGLIIKKE